MKKKFLTPINPVVPKKPKKPVTMSLMNLPEKVDNLPREVIKWIQSLDLTYSVKNIKKDFNNGFLVAQILSRYYPVTNNQAANFKAMQMHSISNELSMKARRDNWNQINKFLIKINDISTRIEDMETFIKNENGEILLFIICLYQELTKRHIPILEGKIISTDIDNINKSFLLKDNGEIEKLKKNDIEALAKGLTGKPVDKPKDKEEQKIDESISQKNEDKKAIEDLGKTSKTNNSFISKTTNNVVMKGDVKPMAAQPAQAEKGFKIKISEPKPYIAQTRTILQPRDSNFRTNVSNNQINKTDKELDAFANYNSLYQNDRDIEQKANSIDNPFLKLGESLMNFIKADFPEDFKKINITNEGNKFFSNFFEAIEDVSDDALSRVVDTVLKIIQDFYNILSGRQVNDYIDVFLIMFNAYINLELNYADDNKKGTILHEGLCNFFLKSLKNKNEEMFFIFKNIFLKKIFETINDKEYQIELFKMFRDKTKNNEEIMYECFAKLHEKIQNLNDSLIDCCLFYVLNGITHENPKIRYHSLQMLLKYSIMNVNFVYNFAPKIEKLAKKENYKNSMPDIQSRIY